MRLYYIVYDDVDGNNWDQFVVAESLEEAVELWRAYVPELGPDGNFDVDPDRVRQVFPEMPMPGPARAVAWDSPEVPVVFTAKDSPRTA